MATAAAADSINVQKQTNLKSPVRARLLDGLPVKLPAHTDQDEQPVNFNTTHHRPITADGRLFASTTEILVLPHSSRNGKPNPPNNSMSLPASQPITTAPTKIVESALNDPLWSNRTGKISLSVPRQDLGEEEDLPVLPVFQLDPQKGTNRPDKTALSRPVQGPGNKQVSINNPERDRMPGKISLHRPVQDPKDDRGLQAAGPDVTQENATGSGVADGYFPEMGVFFGHSGNTNKTAPARGQNLAFPWHVNKSGTFAQNRPTPAQSAPHKDLKIARTFPNEGEDVKLEISNRTIKDGVAEQTPSPPVPRNYSFVESIFTIQHNTSRVTTANHPIIQAISEVLHRILGNTTDPGKTRQHQAHTALAAATVPTGPNKTKHAVQERRRMAREYHRKTQIRRASVTPRMA